MTGYHVTLDGQGYMLDLATYRKRLVAAPHAGALGELAPWQMDDWRRGVGYGLWEPGAYLAGVNVDPSAGDLRIGRSRTAVHSPASVTDLWALIGYGGSLYALRGDGPDIYASADGTTWTNPHDTGYGGHRGACLFNSWLLIGSSSTGGVTKYDGSAWASPWVTLTGNKVAALASWYLTGTTQYLFAGVNQASGGAVLYRVDSAGTITTIGTVLETEITALIAFGGVLWVAAISESGADVRGTLYRYDGVQLVQVQSLADNAITSFVEYRGDLWAGSRTRGKLWTVTAAGLTERWTIPNVEGIGGVSSYGLAIRSLLVDDDRLYVPVVTGDGFGVYVGQPLGPAPGVLSPVPPGPTAPDPVRTPPRPLGATPAATAGATAAIPAMGWSSPSIGSSGQEPRGIASFQGQVYLSNKRSSGASVIRLDGSAANGSAVFVSASFDAGYPSLEKLAVRLRLRHEALAAGDALLVEYDLEDGNAWTTLGTSDTDGATAKTLSFGSTVTFRRIRLRVSFTITDTSRSPALQAIVLEYRPRPAAKAAWEFEARLEGTAALPLVTLDGTPDPKTGVQLADTLWTTAATATALSFIDLDGEAKTVELVALEEKVAERSQRGGTSTRGRIGLQEL
jgi:hypothetical protein